MSDVYFTFLDLPSMMINFHRYMLIDSEQRFKHSIQVYFSPLDLSGAQHNLLSIIQMEFTPVTYLIWATTDSKIRNTLFTF